MITMGDIERSKSFRFALGKGPRSPLRLQPTRISLEEEEVVECAVDFDGEIIFKP